MYVLLVTVLRPPRILQALHTAPPVYRSGAIGQSGTCAGTVGYVLADAPQASVAFLPRKRLASRDLFGRRGVTPLAPYFARRNFARRGYLADVSAKRLPSCP